MAPVERCERPAAVRLDIYAMRYTAILVLLSSLLTWSQTKSSVGKQPSYEGQKVGSVEITASPHVNPDQYMPLIVQKANEPYSEKKIQDSIQALQATNAFSKVDLKVVTDPAGLKLTFLLEPAYYIGLIEFPGALKRFTYARLLQTVDLPD